MRAKSHDRITSGQYLVSPSEQLPSPLAHDRQRIIEFRDAQKLRRAHKCRHSRAKECGQDLVAREAEDPAREGRRAGQSGRSSERIGRQIQAPSFLRTSSLTALPSTFWPASRAMAAFMTRPMSLADAAPVSAIASVTARP